MLAVNWVTIDKASELTGLSREAIRALKKKGQWREKVQWRRSPNGRILISLEGYKQWVEHDR